MSHYSLLYAFHNHRKFTWADIMNMVPFELDIILAIIEKENKEKRK